MDTGEAGGLRTETEHGCKWDGLIQAGDTRESKLRSCWFPIHSRGVASQRIDGSGVPACPGFSLFGLLASLIKYLKYGYNRISRILYFIVLLFEKSVHRK